MSFNVINSNEFEFNAAQGLVIGQEYEVKIKATNYITEFYSLTGSWSPVNTFYARDLPQRVTSLTYSSLTKTGAIINWSLHTAAVDKGYAPSADYILEMDDCKNGPF